MPLGHLVRLIPLKLNEVPGHPAILRYLNKSAHKKHDSESDASKLDPSTADETSLSLDSNGQPRLRPFLKELLDEATSFVDKDLPETFRKKGSKSNPPASAKIDISQRMISSDEISRIPFQQGNIPRKSSKVPQTYGEAW